MHLFLSFHTRRSSVASSGTNRLPYKDAVLRLPTERRALNERREKPVQRGAGFHLSVRILFSKIFQRPPERECGPVFCFHWKGREDRRRLKYALCKRDAGLFSLIQTTVRLWPNWNTEGNQEERKGTKQLEVVQVADCTLRGGGEPEHTKSRHPDLLVLPEPLTD